MQFKLLAFVAAAVAPLCVADPTTLSPATTLFFAPVVTPLPGSSASSSSPSTTTVASTPNHDPDCNKLALQCPIDLDSDSAFFVKLSCVMLFTCRAPFYSPDNTIVVDLWNHKYPPPATSSLPKLSQNIFKQHSSDGKVWTEQNYIDTYYGKLSAIGGPYPASVDSVKAHWANIAAWTGFCETKAIPYQNLADWFSYASSAAGAKSKC